MFGEWSSTKFMEAHSSSIIHGVFCQMRGTYLAGKWSEVLPAGAGFSVDAWHLWVVDRVQFLAAVGLPSLFPH